MSKRAAMIWVELTVQGLRVCIIDLPCRVMPCPHCSPTQGTQRHPEGSLHRGGATDSEDMKEEEEGAKRYREFQNRQVQSLLELREAQADVEAERRLEHLRQVRSVVAWEPGMLPCSGISLLVPLAACVPRLSSGSERSSWRHTPLSSRG